MKEVYSGSGLSAEGCVAWRLRQYRVLFECTSFGDGRLARVRLSQGWDAGGGTNPTRIRVEKR